MCAIMQEYENIAFQKGISIGREETLDALISRGYLSPEMAKEFIEKMARDTEIGPQA